MRKYWELRRAAGGGGHRYYATKYTARITSSSSSGRTLSVELLPPATLPRDPRNYALPRRHLICKATQILLQRRRTNHLIQVDPDPFGSLKDYFSTLSISLTPDEASQILKSLNSPSLALQFFKFYPSMSPSSRHDSFSYTRIIHIISQSNLPDKQSLVKSIISDMEKDGVRGVISTINILIGFFGHTDDLFMCMDLLKKWGLKMNRYTYKCLVQAYLRSHDCVKAFDTFIEMQRKGYKLDIFSYNMLLDALDKDNKVALVYKVFKDMKRHCAPDEYTYTIMIRMIGKSGKPEDSLILFEKMLDRGFSPTLIAYNTLLKALANARLADKSLLIFSKMIEKNCKPNEFTYSIIVNLLASEGKLDKLLEVIEVSKGLMTKQIYTYLIRTLNQLGHASEAHRMFCNMWKSHEKGDRDAYFSMLECLCDAGKTLEAIELLNKLPERGITSNTAMYNSVLCALGKKKQVHYLTQLHEKMKSEGPPPNIFTYNILISGFGRAGEVDEATRVFEELSESNYKPDVFSYNSLINCLGKNDNVDEAHMRFKEMQEKGLVPDVVTYSTLIECFGKSGRVDMARGLYDEMIDKGCYPNIITYNILLECFIKGGRTSEAMEMYARLKEQGLVPDFITCSLLEQLKTGPYGKFKVRKKNPITGCIANPLV